MSFTTSAPSCDGRLSQSATLTYQHHRLDVSRHVLNALMDKAESLKQSYGYSFISIEHLLLALADDGRCSRQFLGQAGTDTSN